MRRRSTLPPDPHLKTTDEAERYVGGAAILQDLCSRWDLRVYTRIKGFVFYSQEDINAAMKRKNLQASN